MLRITVEESPNGDLIIHVDPDKLIVSDQSCPSALLELEAIGPKGKNIVDRLLQTDSTLGIAVAIAYDITLIKNPHVPFDINTICSTIIDEIGSGFHLIEGSKTDSGQGKIEFTYSNTEQGSAL